MVRESKIENVFCAEARAMGALVRKVSWVNHNAAPDRFVLFEGLTLFVEFKAPGEKLRPNQERECDLLREAGAIVKVIDTLEKAQELLDQMSIYKQLKTDDKRIKNIST